MARTYVAATPASTEESKTDRLTVRLGSRELEQLRELARQRGVEMAALGREAIRAYLEVSAPPASLDQLSQGLREEMRAQADRVIARHDQTTRALIAALNEHLAGKP